MESKQSSSSRQGSAGTLQALQGVGAPLEDSGQSPLPGPSYQQGARPFRCVRPGCGWSYLQEVLEKRENARVSVAGESLGRAALEAASKNSSVEGFPSGLQSLYFPGPLSPM